MPRCDEDVLQMYLDGALSPAEREVLEAHLAGCGTCRRTLAAYKLTFWELEHPAPLPVPPDLAALSDRLMQSWTEAGKQTAETAAAPGGMGALAWAGPSMAWLHAPGVERLTAAGLRAGRGVPRAAWTGLRRLLFRAGGGGR